MVVTTNSNVVSLGLRMMFLKELDLLFKKGSGATCRSFVFQSYVIIIYLLMKMY
jgi:hypothetical protein